eukprot:3683929-Pyramimonas_sp.AAC.2
MDSWESPGGPMGVPMASCTSLLGQLRALRCRSGRRVTAARRRSSRRRARAAVWPARRRPPPRCKRTGSLWFALVCTASIALHRSALPSRCSA